MTTGIALKVRPSELVGFRLEPSSHTARSCSAPETPVPFTNRVRQIWDQPLECFYFSPEIPGSHYEVYQGNPALAIPHGVSLQYRVPAMGWEALHKPTGDINPTDQRERWVTNTEVPFIGVQLNANHAALLADMLHLHSPKTGDYLVGHRYLGGRVLCAQCASALFRKVPVDLDQLDLDWMTPSDTDLMLAITG